MARREHRVTFLTTFLRELHGFIHMFEDTPEFVARHILREARAYTDSSGSAVFSRAGALRQDGSYSWHCPGHSGGVAFLKSPVGQMFHQFFGENMLRADVCNAVEELGQLLDHTGPVAASERNAARIFGRSLLFRDQRNIDVQQDGMALDRCESDDIVVVDRNCHKSILHSIIMTGAVPVFLTPTRNNLGIIGPIPIDEFRPETFKRRSMPIRLPKRLRRVIPNASLRILTITQSTYDGIIYNVEALKEVAGRSDRIRCTLTKLGCHTRRSIISTKTCMRLVESTSAEGIDDFRDALDAQVARRDFASFADPWSANRK
jgi:arginine decarboxylase